MSVRIGPYELLEELGSGGHGSVHLARHVELDRLVALKRLDPIQASPRALERFKREAEALARVRHPNVVAFHEVGLHGSTPYLVMERVEGGSLQERLAREGPLAEREAAALVRTLADAVAHLHRAGILHRDLKPANVLLDPRAGPKLTDLGTARLVGELHPRLTRTGEMVGTVAFMAPEQVEGDPTRIDERTDVYGLGATLHALLTGQPPFASESSVTAIARILTETSSLQKLRPELSSQVCEIVDTCLEKSPDRRYPSAQALALALGGLLVQGVEPPRRRWPWGLAIGLVLLFGLGLVWRARSRTRRELPPAPVASLPSARRPLPPPGPDRPVLPGWYVSLPQGSRPPLPEGLWPLAEPGSYRWAHDGSTLVWVPPGKFTMGVGDSAGSLGGAVVGPVPTEVREVTIARGFFLGKYETSWAQWADFCAVTSRTLPPRSLHYEILQQASTLVGTTYHDRTEGMPYIPGDEEPAFRMTWHEATAYCTHHGLRLPTEEEWEWAARGPDPGRRFPWGNEGFGPERLNAHAGPRDARYYTAPVHSYPKGASPCGALNMAGNVKEFTSTPWTVGLGNPFYPEGEQRVITRGGNWSNFHENVFMVHTRTADLLDLMMADCGFRVALDAPTGAR